MNRDAFFALNQTYPEYFGRSNIRALVMVSGGVDSVALLANIFAFTEFTVHAST